MASDHYLVLHDLIPARKRKKKEKKEKKKKKEINKKKSQPDLFQFHNKTPQVGRSIANIITSLI